MFKIAARLFCAPPELRHVVIEHRGVAASQRRNTANTESPPERLLAASSAGQGQCRSAYSALAKPSGNPACA
jgi:hypothetical protein